MRLFLSMVFLHGYLAGACAPVAGVKILASDLVEVVPEFAAADPSQVISFAPLPGATRTLTVKEIGMLARRLGVTVDVTILRDICFQSAVQILTRESILDALANAANIPASSIEVLDFGRAALPPGALQFELSGLNLPPRSTPETPVIWRGRLVSDSGRSVPIWAKVRMVVESPVLVAVVTLHRGQPVLADQVAVESRKHFPVQRGLLAAPEQAVGMTPKVDIAAGQVILAGGLEQARQVSQGDRIRVDVISGEAQISFEAKAQSGGRKGDSILILNPTNGHSFRGVVVEPGRVEVRAIAEVKSSKDVHSGN